MSNLDIIKQSKAYLCVKRFYQFFLVHIALTIGLIASFKGITYTGIQWILPAYLLAVNVLHWERVRKIDLEGPLGSHVRFQRFVLIEQLIVTTAITAFMMSSIYTLVIYMGINAYYCITFLILSPIQLHKLGKIDSLKFIWLCVLRTLIFIPVAFYTVYLMFYMALLKWMVKTIFGTFIGALFQR